MAARTGRRTHIVRPWASRNTFRRSDTDWTHIVRIESSFSEAPVDSQVAQTAKWKARLKCTNSCSCTHIQDQWPSCTRHRHLLRLNRFGWSELRRKNAHCTGARGSRDCRHTRSCCRYYWWNCCTLRALNKIRCNGPLHPASFSRSRQTRPGSVSVPGMRK